MIIVTDRRKEVGSEEGSIKLGEVTQSKWESSSLNKNRWFCIDTDQGYEIILTPSDIRIIKEEILK